MKIIDNIFLGKDFEKNLRERLDYGDKIWNELQSAARILGHTYFVQYADSPDVVMTTVINELANRVIALEKRNNENN